MRSFKYLVSFKSPPNILGGVCYEMVRYDMVRYEMVRNLYQCKMLFQNKRRA